MVPINHSANKEESEVVDVNFIPGMAISPDRLAKVKYSTGMTVNIGDYQSARVDVGIELPTDVEKLNPAYDAAVDFCSERLLDEVGNLQSLKKGLK
jgi:hypothetical protein